MGGGEGVKRGKKTSLSRLLCKGRGGSRKVGGGWEFWGGGGSGNRVLGLAWLA